MSEKIINLRTPIKVNGVEVKTLTMREPNYDDSEAVEKITSPMQRQRVALANLCDITPEEFGRLSMHDVKKITEAFEDFL